MKNLIYLSVLILIFWACGTTQKTPVDKGELATETVDLNPLQKGELLYAQNCGECHELQPPQKFTQEEWKKWVSLMQKNTPLNDEEAGEVLAFLEKNAKDK